MRDVTVVFVRDALRDFDNVSLRGWTANWKMCGAMSVDCPITGGQCG